MLRPTLLAAALAAVYLIWAPASQDLAAATFRADLFADHGFAIWNNAWYDGHYLLSYSVLYPPLGALLGPRLTGALAVVAAAALFATLARRRFGDRALIPSLWFAAAVAAWLLTGRIPFLLAVPFGLGALLDRTRAARGRRRALAAAASLASPVAGLFVALAGAALGLAGSAAPGAGAGARGADPDRGPQPRLPDRRLRALRVLGLDRDPAAGGGRALARPVRVRARCGSGRSSTRCSRSPCS